MLPRAAAANGSSQTRSSSYANIGASLGELMQSPGCRCPGCWLRTWHSANRRHGGLRPKNQSKNSFAPVARANTQHRRASNESATRAILASLCFANIRWKAGDRRSDLRQPFGMTISRLLRPRIRTTGNLRAPTSCAGEPVAPDAAAQRLAVRERSYFAAHVAPGLDAADQDPARDDQSCQSEWENVRGRLARTLH